MVSIPNLDGMPYSDLVAYWRDNINSRGTVGIAARYAIRKANAMEHRLAGRINDALADEAACNVIYERLPKKHRW